jgi:hypothetical protein
MPCPKGRSWFLDFVFKDKGIHRLFVRSASCHTSSAVMKLTFAIFKLLLSGKFEKLLSKEAMIERPNEIITLLKEIRRKFLFVWGISAEPN